MRKAAAVCFVLLIGLSRSAFPEGTAAHKGHNGSFALSDTQETAGFSLALHAGTVNMIAGASVDTSPDPDFDRPDLMAGAATAGIGPEMAALVFKKNAPAPISLSVFLGQGNGDLFSSLHELYAWRAKFKSMTLGAGVYRDIPLSKTIRFQPYVGVIRSHARLRPSDLFRNSESFEYRLTALCFGLPLVCGF